MRLREACADILSKEELKMLPSGFDTIGDIAILEIPDELRDKESEIGEVLLGMHNHIQTVVAKDSPHEGELRTRSVRHLAGEEKTTTLHKESKAVMEIDVESMYFSPRLSHERLRIASLVQEGERVLVMFSGCGPYPLVIAKNSDAKHIVGVELNEVAHEYAQQNVERNKLVGRVEVVQGDVREVVPELGQFDRIAMPLPEGGEDFLDIALEAIKPGGTIHFYDFLHEEDIPKAAYGKVRDACAGMDMTPDIQRHELCGQIGVRKHRVCVDFLIESKEQRKGLLRRSRATTRLIGKTFSYRLNAIIDSTLSRALLQLYYDDELEQYSEEIVSRVQRFVEVSEQLSEPKEFLLGAAFAQYYINAYLDVLYPKMFEVLPNISNKRIKEEFEHLWKEILHPELGLKVFHSGFLGYGRTVLRVSKAINRGSFEIVQEILQGATDLTYPVRSAAENKKACAGKKALVASKRTCFLLGIYLTERFNIAFNHHVAEHSDVISRKRELMEKAASRFRHPESFLKGGLATQKAAATWDRRFLFLFRLLYRRVFSSDDIQRFCSDAISNMEERLDEISPGGEID